MEMPSGKEVRAVQPPDDESIHMLETLDFHVRTNHLLINVDWFRPIYHYDVPNHAWHEHRSVEMHFVVNGSVTFHLRDRTVDVMGGQAILIPANVPHKLQNHSGQIYYRYVLKFTIEPLTDDPEALFMANTLDVREVKIIPIFGRVTELLEDSRREATERVNGFRTMIETNLIDILMIVARALTDSAKATYAVREKKHSDLQRIRQIMDYIEADAMAGLSVEELAQRVFLSPRQIQRLVRQQYGMTVRELMMRRRFERAKEMLKDPDKSIAEISASLGFSSAQSFCRFFRRMEGEPPAHYRNSTLARRMQALEQDDQGSDGKELIP